MVHVYRTIAPSEESEGWRQELQAGQVHLMTFTSPSTVHNFVTMLGGIDAVRPLVQSVAIAAIGPITGRTIEQYGLTVSIMPRENTIPALVDAMAQHYTEREPLVL